MDPKSTEGEVSKHDKREIEELAYQICSIILAEQNKEETTKDSAANTSEDEEDKDSCESDQEWDVDSFKDVDFHSEDEPDDEEWRRYVRQCYKSEGFDVDYDLLPTNKNRLYSGFYPVNLESYYSRSPEDVTWRQKSEKMINVVIEKYNQTKGKSLVLDHIVRTIVKMSVGIKAYITFMAKESPDGDLVEYQGKAEWKVWQRNVHPILCRPASEQKQRD